MSWNGVIRIKYTFSLSCGYFIFQFQSAQKEIIIFNNKDLLLRLLTALGSRYYTWPEIQDICDHWLSSSHHIRPLSEGKGVAKSKAIFTQTSAGDSSLTENAREIDGENYPCRLATFCPPLHVLVIFTVSRSSRVRPAMVIMVLATLRLFYVNGRCLDYYGSHHELVYGLGGKVLCIRGVKWWRRRRESWGSGGGKHRVAGGDRMVVVLLHEVLQFGPGQTEHWTEIPVLQGETVKLTLPW